MGRDPRQKNLPLRKRCLLERRLLKKRLPKSQLSKSQPLRNQLKNQLKKQQMKNLLRNQKKNQPKLPTMMPISTREGRYIPQAKGSYSWDSDVTMITYRGRSKPADHHGAKG